MKFGKRDLKMLSAALYAAAKWEDDLGEAWFGNKTREGRQAIRRAATYRKLRAKIADEFCS